jgi:hypothetical protein
LKPVVRQHESLSANNSMNANAAPPGTRGHGSQLGPTMARRRHRHNGGTRVVPRVLQGIRGGEGRKRACFENVEKMRAVFSSVFEYPTPQSGIACSISFARGTKSCLSAACRAA